MVKPKKTTIQIDEEVLNYLNSIKVHKRQSYNEVLRNMIEKYVRSDNNGT